MLLAAGAVARVLDVTTARSATWCWGFVAAWRFLAKPASSSLRLVIMAALCLPEDQGDRKARSAAWWLRWSRRRASSPTTQGHCYLPGGPSRTPSPEPRSNDGGTPALVPASLAISPHGCTPYRHAHALKLGESASRAVFAPSRAEKFFEQCRGGLKPDAALIVATARALNTMRRAAAGCGKELERSAAGSITLEATSLPASSSAVLVGATAPDRHRARRTPVRRCATLGCRRYSPTSSGSADSGRVPRAGILKAPRDRASAFDSALPSLLPARPSSRRSPRALRGRLRRLPNK